MANTLLSTETAPRAWAEVEQRFRIAANMLAGYVYEARFVPGKDRSRHEIIWASDGFERIFGRSVAEYNRAQHWRSFYHPEELRAAGERTAALLRGEAVESDVRVLRPDGSVRWLRVSNRPVFDAHREVIGVVGLGMDITERKIADQAVKKSELILRSLTCNAPDWLLLLNADFTVQFLNRSFLDRAPEDWQGRQPFDAFDDDQRRRARTVLLGVQRSRTPAGFEMRLGPEEHGFHYEVSVAPVMENAEAGGLALRISDITERRRVAATLQTHATILQTMREGVLMFDPAGNIRFFNAAASQMFGHPAAQFGRLQLAHLGLDAAQILRRLQDEQPPPGGLELTCIRRDLSEFIAAFIFNRIELHGQPMVIGVVKDMTQRKQLERQVAEMSSREQQRIAGDLHDGVSQDLTGISLLLRLLADRSGDGLPAAGASLEEIISLVNQAIRKTRMLARGIAPLEIERGDLASALACLAADARESHRMEVRFSENPGGAPALDPEVAEHLYRIAQEALANALRHAKARQIGIGLTMKRGSILLTIDDDGCGMPPASDQDPGLGLRVMRYRAQLIGATLTLRPIDGGGTRVSCRWGRAGRPRLN